MQYIIPSSNQLNFPISNTTCINVCTFCL